ncbi:hypothetical protein QBC33DRAFT_562977 [Phialemonium atrogriseum]|uniref:Uncharacterized protein n=1 Tax=Phialemonium atrogriseum TaxID=1093897 RepID=A0AAJ0BS12_9PEZI|nr:uncharacterized protein QBC33DRAFT_562977 [Phialemonium atrogriseum]KAK1763195.1 hypothetical protein QBC33DRAFT_562977 [Phialemonium atrogriseum]
MIFPPLITLGQASSRDPSTAILSQDQKSPCDGGRRYCGWFEKSSETLPKPECSSTQKVICARNSKEWCDYDENNELCKSDGTNVVIIIEIDIEVTVIEPTIEEECSKPKCPDCQTIREDGECHYPCFPEETVDTCKKKGGKPVCAKTPDEFCELCQDDVFNSFHCVDEDEDESDCLVGAYADLDLNLSLSVLGSGCIANGVGCVLNDNIWGQLYVVCDVVGILCSLLDALLGLC